MAQVTQDPIGLISEETPQEETPQEAAESAEDSLLDRLDAAEDEIGIALSDMSSDDGDDPIGDGVADPEPKEETEDTPSDQEEDREQPEPIDGDEMDKAISALRRDGLSADVIEKMTNQEVLDLGLKRAKVQADTDNAYRELQELKKSEKDTPESTEESATVEPADQPLRVPDEAVKPFEELFGEDGAKALQGYQKAVLSPIMAQLNQVVQVIGQYTAKEARRELSDKYPQLADDQAFSQVEERMGKLIKSGTYNNAEELMADAARLTFADDQRDAAKAYRDKTRQMRNNGQMSSTSKQSAPAALSQDEREDRVLELLEDGGSRDDARRAYDG